MKIVCGSKVGDQAASGKTVGIHRVGPVSPQGC